MKRVIVIVLVLLLLTIPVQALELDAPRAPRKAEQFMPDEPENLQEALYQILREVLFRLRPDLKEACASCLSVIGSVIVISLVGSFSGRTKGITELAGVVLIAGTLLNTSGSLIQLGMDTVSEISEYGKLLLPVLTAGLAAQGGVSTSAALYSATALFNGILSSLISKVLRPMIYLYLALAAGNCAVHHDALKKLRDTVKWTMTWSLKNILYLFTGFIGITGVISGTTDAAALKAAKLTISGMVPVVGGILSDASEAILVGAAAVKNAAGIYGLFAVLAIWLGPFLKIGTHYLILKLTGGICGVFGSKNSVELINDFATAMGLLLGSTAAVCFIFLISAVCFMRGMG